MQKIISWTLPTTYTDATSIDPTDISKIIIHIFKDGVEVYNTLPGVTTFPIEVVPNETNNWQLQADMGPDRMSELSPPYSYKAPFQIPVAPMIGSIS